MEETELHSAVRGWVKRSTSRGLRVFIFGKTGVGKSSLINTLLGKELAGEGAGIRSHTREVTSYTEERNIETVRETIEGVNVTMWDSPGLSDPKADERLTLKDIAENCRDVDIFVYCTPIIQIRLGQDDLDSIRNLTQALGDDIWKKGLIALTFSNEIRVPPNIHDSLEDYFRNRVSEWGEALRFAVTKAGVNGKDAEAIPVVPASYRDIPLPDSTGADWFLVFWSKCVERTKLGSLPALLRIKKGPILESPYTRSAVVGRMIAEKLRIIADEIDAEIYRTTIGDNYKRMFNTDPSLLSEVLITTSQNPDNFRGFIIYGIWALSMIAVLGMAARRSL